MTYFCHKDELAWHFLQDDRSMRFREPKEFVEEGKTYTQAGHLVPCKNGLHASLEAMEALHYAPSHVVSRVKITGVHRHYSDKLVAHNREVLWIRDATPALRKFQFYIASRIFAFVSEMQTVRTFYKPYTDLMAAWRGWDTSGLDVTQLIHFQNSQVCGAYVGRVAPMSRRTESDYSYVTDLTGKMIFVQATREQFYTRQVFTALLDWYNPLSCTKDILVAVRQYIDNGRSNWIPHKLYQETRPLDSFNLTGTFERMMLDLA